MLPPPSSQFWPNCLSTWVTFDAPHDAAHSCSSRFDEGNWICSCLTLTTTRVCVIGLFSNEMVFRDLLVVTVLGMPSGEVAARRKWRHHCLPVPPCLHDRRPLLRLIQVYFTLLSACSYPSSSSGLWCLV
jgi:hypothetical protein